MRTIRFWENLELTGTSNVSASLLQLEMKFIGMSQMGRVLDYYSENPPKVFLRLCLNVSRFICAIEVVRGMSLGQTRTQFCALPHEVIPSAPIMAERRTSLFMAPVG